MTWTLILALALGGLTVGLAAGWAVAAAAWLAVRAGALSRRPAPVRARLLAQARLAPLGGALPIAPVVLVAFLRFEPARGHEVAGPVLLALAACAVAALGEALCAGIGAARATTRLRARWRASATPLEVEGWQGPAWQVDEGAPVAAVVGVRRPVLVISARVVAGCSPAELGAIAAHERAHVEARDNLVRWAFRLTPGARLAACIVRGLDAQWATAAEEAADRHARRVAGGRPLASALVKVARLASAGLAPAVASAFIGGDSLDRRVRRVLAELGEDPRDAGTHGVVGWLVPCLALTLAVAACASPWLVTVHRAFEALITAAR